MSRSPRLDLVAMAAVAVITLGGLGYAVRPQQTPVSAVTPAEVAVSRPQPPDVTRPSALFIGDSYTAGAGLTEMSYGCQASARLHWLCHLSAVHGTGYISGGPANRFIVDRYTGPSTSFGERIPALSVTYRPDVVVLDGGRNDQFPPRDDVRKAMVATVRELHDIWPAATIVFIRPRLLNKPADDLGFDDEFVGRLTRDAGVTAMVVIDPIFRFANTDTSALLDADRVHPNLEGERRLADALVESLIRSGVVAAT